MTFKSRLNLIMVEQAKRNLSVDECIADGRLRRLVNDFTERFQRRKSQGAFSQTGVRTISDLVLLLKYAAGKLPIDDFRHDFPGAGEPVSPIDLLDITLGHAVDELSRPIDAIRHQAKTVTVGTSRKETPPGGVLFDLVAELSFTAKSLLSTNVLVLRRYPEGGDRRERIHPLCGESSGCRGKTGGRCDDRDPEAGRRFPRDAFAGRKIGTPDGDQEGDCGLREDLRGTGKIGRRLRCDRPPSRGGGTGPDISC